MPIEPLFSHFIWGSRIGRFDLTPQKRLKIVVFEIIIFVGFGSNMYLLNAKAKTDVRR